MLQIDPLSLIPDSLKAAVRDAAVDFVSEQAKKFLGDEVSSKIKGLRSDAEFNKKFEQGLKKALKRFVDEYAEQDEDLVAAIEADATIFRNEQVRKALLEMLKNPGRYLTDEHETINENFATVLPERRKRERVDRAVAFLLRCLTEELWNLPELQPIYNLQFQRMTAESMHQQVELQKAQLHALTTVNEGVRHALLQLTDAIAENKLLPSLVEGKAPDKEIQQNLPNAEYGQFVGRETEIEQIYKILRPYPHSQHSLVTIDGIGGIGKSTLALEVGHYYLRNANKLPKEETFDAIIWASAKQTVLTAQGIKNRPQVFRTLEDIYTAIAITLQRQDITKASSDEQSEVVRNALTHQRTLLIIDNLETIDDEKVITFLRELPAPTKAIVTTRHRVDVAYPIRLKGMPWSDAQILIQREVEKRNFQLSDEDALKLYNRTGGVPLAIVWSIAQISFGHSTENVLRRLGDASGDIARFCFEGSAQPIKAKPAFRLLMALSLFASDATREALGEIADLSILDRDEGLVELERLSLVDKKGARFGFLPITKSFALAELNKDPDLQLSMGKRWVSYLLSLYSGGNNEYYWRYKTHAHYDEGENILDAINWSLNYGTAEQIFELSYAAYDYLDVVGRWNELLELLDKTYNLAFTIQKNNQAAKYAMPRASHMKGWILMQRGDYDQAEENLRIGLDQYRLAGSQEGELMALANLGSIYRKRGDYQKAKELYDQAWLIAEDINDGDTKALINTDYGKLYRDLKQWNISWEYFNKVQDWFDKRVAETPRDEPLARGTWGHLAIIAYHLGRFTEAKELCLRSLEYYREWGTKGYRATLTYRLALIEYALGEFAPALLHASEAVGWFDRLGMKPDYADALILLQKLENQG